MTYSICAVCDREEKDDHIPGWIQFGNGRTMCELCQQIVMEMNREERP